MITRAAIAAFVIQALFACGLFAQNKDVAPRVLSYGTIAARPTAASAGANAVYVETDGATTCDTSTGSGTTQVIVISDGTNWNAPNCGSTVGAASLTATNVFTGRQDTTGAASTSIKTGTSLPGSCTTGDLFFKSNATAGQNIYECISNVWTQQSGGGGLGSAACSSISVVSTTYTLAYSSTVNCNRISITGGSSGSWTVALPTPGSNASGPYILEVTNVTPTAAPVVYGGAGCTACPQPASKHVNDVTNMLLFWTGSQWEPAPSNPTGTALTSGQIAASDGTNGPFIPATAANIVSTFSGCSGTLLLGADGACHAGASPTSNGAFMFGVPSYTASGTGSAISVNGSSTNGGQVWNWTANVASFKHFSYVVTTAGSAGTKFLFGIFDAATSNTAICVSAVGVADATGAKTAAVSSGSGVSGGVCSLTLGQGYVVKITSESATAALMTYGDASHIAMMQLNQTCPGTGCTNAGYAAAGALSTGSGGSLAFATTPTLTVIPNGGNNLPQVIFLDAN